jgi:ribosomal protein S18 acetylase RimI-like enzyme
MSINNDIEIRNAGASDHARIMAVMLDWWDGRDLRAMLPKLFLEHFCDTSFIAEYGGELVGFLVGFLSQARPDEAYIHFIGVHPNYRQQGLAKTLYERFFEICKGYDRKIIRAVTAPVNTGSIRFHTRMGFDVEKGESKMLFYKQLVESK